MSRAIELKDVSFRYAGYEETVLNHVNFTLEHGEIALLCGFSGEGKSTLLNLICGIIPNVTPGETTGEVLVDGSSTEGKSLGDVCRQVGVVLQNAEAQIIQDLVEDEIAFGCENLGVSREDTKDRITRACAVMELEPAWKTRTLSGGQKQRLITASTLAMQQKILLLDEPLANLDRQGAVLLMSRLQNLAHDEGYAVLVVEHRIDMVLPYVDTVWNISGGTVHRVEDRTAYLETMAGIIPDTLDAPQQAEAAPAFSLQDVRFRIGGRDILTGVTVDIPQGERTLLLGENGCGKTTLLRLLARLYQPTGGTITQGIDPKYARQKKGSKAWFRDVGVVYQNPNYQLFMPTVRDELLFGAASEDVVDDLLQVFQLESIADRHPQSLSEGQKRRVSIAAVCATEPKVLLLDEPTVGQDFTGLTALCQILNDLHARTGNTMITITHDMRCAEALCDHAFQITDGGVSATGGKELAHAFFTSRPG